ncbi:hypothetical protein CRM22_010917 [Opisthorchis felineus]|uniref:Secreted protein n=1 Tax=Opisthorchis felineus TaxID=147828 RepID=A0A4S2KMZ9_OPIFE|nr:hypothetical protein CRM22_010917 [Opisthorchis felineus]
MVYFTVLIFPAFFRQPLPPHILLLLALSCLVPPPIRKQTMCPTIFHHHYIARPVPASPLLVCQGMLELCLSNLLLSVPCSICDWFYPNELTCRIFLPVNLVFFRLR